MVDNNILILLIVIIGFIHKNPEYVKSLFKNTIFKILVLTLVTYLSLENIEIALVVGVAYIFTYIILKCNETEETFSLLEEYINYEKYNNCG
jgi:hypothetical protein